MPQVVLLLAQIAVILLAARIVGRIAFLIGQPRVVGEMLAGILLGPSLFGALAPETFDALFPSASLGFLSALSQIGLIFFMFLVGLELDLKLLRGQGRAAVITSHASIVAPFFLGVCLALALYPRLSDDSVAFVPFALFLGAAMSVTAFPVLARMLTETGLLKTPLGAITIAAAAVDDATAWCILALVILVARAAESTAGPMLFMVGGTVLYAALMLTLVRYGLRWFQRFVIGRGYFSQDMLAAVAFFVIASALATEAIGVHAVFGGFVAGVVMPRDERLTRPVLDRLHDVMVVLFLPLFFAFTGLRTSIGLIEGDLWAWCALVILVAVAGKMAGSAVAARAAGISWQESWAIGTLMNTRGLMELVVLNVGLDIGVISPALFAMMVVMALVTTFMTLPVLARIYPFRMRRSDSAPLAEPG